ncbi:hypothetical protein RSOLAG1IB_05851 [Rhizoctonia solani AG-1 IB]|uniref:Hemerythrin-like domain-containing protein n=1 Tax=Thanatephorus cucumeris (strain AG1-IB / isolate 7/3/14) TaxID=1108050 RepID=A0A0B7F3M3_THACB|nr:hypothetical protein RSOLAG1IB_05851 [Rhizoctonia solani AG-1 IB]
MESPYCLFSTPPGDWRTDVFALQSIRMAALYNVVIRTLNSIIHHAHIINEPEVPGLMDYCCNLATLIRYHAMVEDFIFICLDMALPEKQRTLIPKAMDLKDLDIWADYCSSIRKDRAKYHPDKAVSLLKRFADPMFTHMERSMVLLDADLLKHHIQLDMLKSFESELEAKNQGDCLPFSAAPLLILNCDRTHNSWFPPVPSAAIIVLRYIVIPLNSSTWKFSQCDTYMRPKNETELYQANATAKSRPLLHIAIGLLVLVLSYPLWTMLGHPTLL